MSDWQIGDLALCVDASRRAYSGPDSLKDLRVGKAYSVCGFRLRDNDGGLNLIMEGDHARLGWAADRFRKIRPDEHESCEPEFVQLLKRSKQRINAYDPFGPLGIAAE